MKKDDILNELKELQEKRTEFIQQLQNSQQELNSRQTNIIRLEGVIGYLKNKLKEEKV